MTLEQLNAQPADAAYAELASCCVAENWVNAMVKARPFQSVDEVLQTAETIWQGLTDADYLEAFEGHPRIGDVSTLKKKFAHTAAAAGHEQSEMQAADDAVLEKMKVLNDDYFEKFGFIFIVCASGKTAAQMLELIEARYPNDAQTELAIAAGEQAKITSLRLQKLLATTE